MALVELCLCLFKFNQGIFFIISGLPSAAVCDAYLYPSSFIRERSSKGKSVNAGEVHILGFKKISLIVKALLKDFNHTLTIIELKVAIYTLTIHPIRVGSPFNPGLFWSSNLQPRISGDEVKEHEYLKSFPSNCEVSWFSGIK